MPSFADEFDNCISNRPLAPLVTARVGGVARYFFAPESADELAHVLASCRSAGIPWFILGGGSNVLPPDGVLEGAVIATQHLQRSIWSADGVRAEAGAPLAKLLRGAISRGLQGLEVATGVPGTVGGAVFGNAGTRLGAIGDVLERVRAIDPDGRDRWIDRDAVAPKYRETALAGHVILEVELGLARGDAEELKQRVDEYLEYRRRTQPAGPGMLGCFFKNPQGASGTSAAGALIDRAGLKGEPCGGVVVSEHHANFLVKRGEASASDFHRLARRVQSVVEDRFGVRLATEVRLWGLPPERVTRNAAMPDFMRDTARS